VRRARRSTRSVSTSWRAANAIRRALDGLREDLARMLEEGVRGGWLRADLDAALFADLMLGLLLGGREHAARTGRPIDEIAREVERIALDGIRAGPSTV
jgi:AcrR family transcriptional regulator